MTADRHAAFPDSHRKSPRPEAPAPLACTQIRTHVSHLPRRATAAYSKAQPVLKPSLRAIIAAGQKPVKAAWIMFRPANTPRKYQ